MNKKVIINQKLYKKFATLKCLDLTLPSGSIRVNPDQKTVVFTSISLESSFTLFAHTRNSMRYIPYTVDSLMANIILTFGYQSDMHRKLHRLLIDFNFISPLN